ncbi:multidrug ABC transporter ATP-binding protein [Actinosynnema sp. ALI-1.44]|uniref:ABC transporter transmembrane domain-containing protein n=1 Tax=Actinosynnema sp. ALI-1.44 TaxID=1933779 RepID=UPI00097BC801|nr:ABC transporter ATP-binding protein [Actinosynnema sp. ALI-1.44]ONI78140.1 multidrug ABC transporter ATP-binding protein [Actinosynnema sp. ALI-1.44]
MFAQRGRILAASALLVAHQAGEAAVPVLIGVVIDKAVASGQTSRLLFWLAVLALDFLVLSLCWRFGTRIGTVAGVQADRRLRLAVTTRALAGPIDMLPGAVVSVATSDARRTTMVNFVLPHGIAAAVGAIVAGTALLAVSIPLGLLIVLGTPPLLLLVRLMSMPLERRSSAQQERAADAAGVATDLVRGVRILKGIGAERAALARYRRISRESLRATLHTTRAEAGYSAAVIVVNGVFLAIVALVGGRLAASGSITVGQLVSAAGLAVFLVGPLNTFGEITAALAAGRASAGRIAETVGQPDIAADSVEIAMAEGEFVCVVTEEPAPLLRGLAARSDVLVSPHHADLFAGTIIDNVTAAAAPHMNATEVMRAAGVDQVADALPDGLRTTVTERGRSLSGGQRQRVALARALLADPPILVLHDPTTAVDAVTEAEIARGIRTIRDGRTTVVITTSPALLAEADRVLFAGTSGTHAHLIRDNADYRAAVLA